MRSDSGEKKERLRWGSKLCLSASAATTTATMSTLWQYILSSSFLLAATTSQRRTKRLARFCCYSALSFFASSFSLPHRHNLSDTYNILCAIRKEDRFLCPLAANSFFSTLALTPKCGAVRVCERPCLDIWILCWIHGK